MPDRKDWYYEQLVLEDELDDAFGGLEDSDWAMASDWGLCRDDDNEAEYGGIFWGLSATHVSGLDMSVSKGAGYDGQGRRIGHKPAGVYPDDSTTVTVSDTGTTDPGTGGVPAGGTSTTPSVGFERWVTIFIVYDRILSDPRYDGYNNLVYADRAESWHFYVSMGTEKTIGSLLDSDRPPREDGKLLITDVQIRNTAGYAVYHYHDHERREIFFRVTASGAPEKQLYGERVRDVLKNMLQMYNEHIGGEVDKHAADNVTYPGGETWANGTGGLTGAATTVEEGLDGIVGDLKATTAVAGSARMGSKVQTGTLQEPTSASPLSLAAGTLEAQLTAIMDAINGRVFRGGDSSIAGPLSPKTDGLDLGTAALSWDALLRDLTVKGALKSDLVPDGNLTRVLGAASLKFGEIYVGDVEANNVLAETSLKVGTVGGGVNPVEVNTAGQQIWGKNATYTAGRASMEDDGELVLKNGCTVQPLSGMPTPQFNWDPKNLALPNSSFIKNKCQVGAGASVNDGHVDAFGVRKDGYSFLDDFSGIKPGYNLLAVPDIPNMTYGGSGAQIYRLFTLGGHNGLALMTGGVSGNKAHLSGPGMWSPFYGALLHVRLAPQDVTNVKLFVGLTSTTELSLPLLTPGSQNLLGLYWSAPSTYYQILASSGTAQTTVNTGITPSAGVAVDFYLYCNDSMQVRWWMTGKSDWQDWDAAFVDLTSVVMHLYAHVETLEAASKTLILSRWCGKQPQS